MFERRPVAVPNHGIGLDPPAFGAKPQKRSLCTLFAPLFNPYCVCVYACANQYLNKKLGSRWYIYIYIYVYIYIFCTTSPYPFWPKLPRSVSEVLRTETAAVICTMSCYCAHCNATAKAKGELNRQRCQFRWRGCTFIGCDSHSQQDRQCSWIKWKSHKNNDEYHQLCSGCWEAHHPQEWGHPPLEGKGGKGGGKDAGPAASAAAAAPAASAAPPGLNQQAAAPAASAAPFDAIQLALQLQVSELVLDMTEQKMKIENLQNEVADLNIFIKKLLQSTHVTEESSQGSSST